MKKIFFNFIKDNAMFIIGFYISLSLIIFYYFITFEITDIFYPILIATTVFVVIFFISWLKYYYFNSNIDNLVNLDNNSKYFDMTNEQKKFLDMLNRLKKSYLEEISEINYGNNSFKYFFSQWVHNMKTPVSVISLILQKFESEKISAKDPEINIKIKEFIKGINEENIKLQNGLEQLLNMIRMDEFVRDYEPDAVDLIASLKEIINYKKSLFIYNNVFPRIDSADEKIIVLTDEKWNKFMLEQIINNAVKYSALKDKKKNVIFKVEKNEKNVILKIIDEGVGISKSDLVRVFEPFFTGENGRKYKDASGIGLYICSLIAKNLSHKLEIKSEVGKGTTVTITYILNL